MNTTSPDRRGFPAHEDIRTEPPDGPPEAVLPLRVREALPRAAQGDQTAWAILYAAAAGYARTGSPMPADLGAMIAARLQAVADVLASPREKDKRAALPAAIAPGAKRGRKPQRLGDAPGSVLAAFAEDVARIAGPDATPDRIEQALDYVLALMPRKPDTDEPLYSRDSLALEAKLTRP